MRTSSILISGAVAAVAVAGSANTAVAGVSLWNFSDFTIGTTPTGATGGPGATTGGNSGVVAGNPLPNWSTTLWRTQTSMTGSGGLVNVALGGSFSAQARFNLIGTTPVNLTGTTSFDINVTNYSGQSTQWGIEIFDVNGEGAFMYSTVYVGAIGNQSFSTSSNWTNSPGFDWSKVVSVQLAFTRNSTSVNAGSIASSFSFDSFTAVGAVPAPGALALLGAAGLAGARRRRA